MEFLELPQMQRAFVIALIAGPVGGLLGAFIILRGLSFFSDAISHAAMTGVALGFLLNLASDIGSPMMQLTLVTFCVSIALMMAWLFEKTNLRADTVIAFSYTGSVALGVILISKLRGYRVLEGALFGDILAASRSDIYVISGLALVVVFFIVFNLRALTLTIVQESLARLEGVNGRRLNYIFVGLIAVVIALLLRQLGALLISGLIVVPAAAARVVAGNFRAMLVLSPLFGLVGAACGVFSSYHLDLQTGPTIVLTDVVILTGCLLAMTIVQRLRLRRMLRPAIDSVPSS